MVARRTSLRRHFGQNHGNGRAGVWVGSVGIKGSGIVDTHKMNGWILWVVILEDDFQIDRAAGERQTEVIVIRPSKELLPRFSNLVGDSAALTELVHRLGDVLQGQPPQVVRNPS